MGIAEAKTWMRIEIYILQGGRSLGVGLRDVYTAVGGTVGLERLVKDFLVVPLHRQVWSS